MADAPPEFSFPQKHREFAEATMSLQRTLRDTFAEILPHEYSARSIARRLSIGKTLGWQLLRIATSPDAATILSAFPGERPMTQVLESLGTQGVSAEAIAGLDRAARTLRGLFERYGASSREVLTIAAGGLDDQARRRHHAKMLRMHFESSVAIRGELANAQIGAWMVAPSRQDPSLVDLVGLNMLDGFRTIRPLGPRVVHRGVSVDRDAVTADWSKVDRGDAAGIPALVPVASTPDLGDTAVQVRSSPQGYFVLADPDEHPDRTLTLTFGSHIEAVGSIHRTAQDRTGELTCQLAVPSRHLYFDILFHADIPPVEPAAALYFAANQGVEYGEYAELRRFTGEIEGRFVRSRKLPAAVKVDPAKHAAMLEHGAAMIDRPLEAFRCFRMHIAYPPSYTRAVVRWLLPDPPKAPA